MIINKKASEVEAKLKTMKLKKNVNVLKMKKILSFCLFQKYKFFSHERENL